MKEADDIDLFRIIYRCESDYTLLFRKQRTALTNKRKKRKKNIKHFSLQYQNFDILLFIRMFNLIMKFLFPFCYIFITQSVYNSRSRNNRNNAWFCFYNPISKNEKQNPDGFRYLVIREIRIT